MVTPENLSKLGIFPYTGTNENEILKYLWKR